MAVHLLFHIVASFLMIEMALVVVLLVPFIRATTWVRLVESDVWPKIRKVVNATIRCEFRYKYFVIGIVTIVAISFLDASRDIYRHYFPDISEVAYIAAKENPCYFYIQEEKYYRESKNFLVTGFTLYLTIVLVLLRETLAKKAELEEKASTVKQPIESDSTKEIADLRDSKMAVTIELEKKNEALVQAEEELAKIKEMYSAMTKDYDVLTEQLKKQTELQNPDIGDETKKDL